MVDILHLYISAALDLEKERESLSRAVAEIPVTLGWRVIQSPLHGEPLDTDAIAQADVHILLLGSDIRAPDRAGMATGAARQSPTRRLPETGCGTDDGCPGFYPLSRRTHLLAEVFGY